MKRGKEFETILASLSRAYQGIDDAYQVEVKKAERKDAGWVKEREEIRRAVFDTVEEIHDRDIRDQVKGKITEIRYRFDPKEAFIRMCYYIDRINGIHVSKKVKRSNPDYGKTVIESISRCASQVLGYLLHVDASRRTDTREAKNIAAERIKEKWAETLAGPIKALAHEEALEIIAEVEAEVGGTHG